MSHPPPPPDDQPPRDKPPGDQPSGEQPPDYPPPSYPPGGYPPPPGYPPPGGQPYDYAANPYGGGYGYPQQSPGTNQKAIWSLVTGIAGLLCCGLLGIPALILGNSAKREITMSGGRQGGGGLATAGIVLGVLALLWTVLAAILFATGALDLDFAGTAAG